MVKPGYFDPQTAESFTTPGLSFFLVLPGPPDPVTTFNEMVQTAKQVAQSLNGELLDADRSSFSGQRAQLIQDEIVEFMQRHGDN
jgi:cell division protein ZipA